MALSTSTRHAGRVRPPASERRRPQPPVRLRDIGPTNRARSEGAPLDARGQVAKIQGVSPALRLVPVTVGRVPLGQPASVHRLRSRFPGRVRRLRGYYRAVRLPAIVRHRRPSISHICLPPGSTPRGADRWSETCAVPCAVSAMTTTRVGTRNRLSRAPGTRAHAPSGLTGFEFTIRSPPLASTCPLSASLIAITP